MRKQLLVFVVAAVAASGIFASSAFQAAQSGTRTVSIAVVGDANAYLALEAVDASGWECIVDVDGTSSLITIDFSDLVGCTGAGSGTGVQKSSTYIFKDMIKFTNKGHKHVTGLWINSSDTTQLKVAASAYSGQLRDGYLNATNWAVTSTGTDELQVGKDWFIGFKITPTANPSTLTPTITIEARTD